MRCCSQFVFLSLCAGCLSVIACGENNRSSGESPVDAPALSASGGNTTSGGGATLTPPKGNSDGASGGTGGMEMDGVVIDDFSDCDSKVVFASAEGDWYAYNSGCEGLSGDQTPEPGCDASAPFELEKVGDQCRVRTTGGGFPNSEADGWGYALVGVQLSAPFDACAFAGISVTSGGSGVRFKLTMPDTAGDSDHFGAPLPSGTSTINFSDLKQEGWGTPATLDCKKVDGVIFQATDATEFDYWIDSVSWVEGGGNEPVPVGGAPSEPAVVMPARPLAACDAPDLIWKSGKKTNYTSYPEPNSEECNEYNGCMWAGQFAHCSGKRPEAWVAAHNIAAVFPDTGLEGHDICIRSGDKSLIVTVIDTCGDSDCDGCCTRNQGEADALIDLETYTNARWGLPDGQLQWADLGANADSCTE